jgi:hypothetical protein
MRMVTDKTNIQVTETNKKNALFCLKSFLRYGSRHCNFHVFYFANNLIPTIPSFCHNISSPFLMLIVKEAFYNGLCVFLCLGLDLYLYERLVLASLF